MREILLAKITCSGRIYCKISANVMQKGTVQGYLVYNSANIAEFRSIFELFFTLCYCKLLSPNERDPFLLKCVQVV